MKKAARKNTKYDSRNQTMLQIAYLAKAIAHVKGTPVKNALFGSKIKNAKIMRKTILQEHYSCSVQKTARKNTKYSRNETILKMGYLPKAIAHAKAIAFAKWSVWVKNLKMPTPCKKPFYTNIRVVLCKKPLEKTPNIRQMRRFLKSAILQRLESMPRVYLLQNGHFGSKIKNAKIMQKNILQEH